MPKASDILGMNARNQMYAVLNSPSARSLASSKYASKIILENNEIPTAKIYAVMATNEDINDFDWRSLEGNFVIKPTNGNAGKGVLVIKKQHSDREKWTDAVGHVWKIDDIKLHCFDILEGQFSTYGSQHNVIIEERVPIHPTFKKYTYKGTPDIRVIIFNQVPVMAMLRLPTPESEGRANVSQGAIAVGIDIATGITTYATKDKHGHVGYLPGTKRKLNGIKIPSWKTLLKLSIDAANCANLKFAGIDLFVHPEKGPMVVELNANPGLSIQVANKAGLKRRLERVEGLNVINSTHGVKIGQALFAESFADKIKSEEGLIILNPKEIVLVYGDNKTVHEINAIMSTGRYRSAISKTVAEKLGLIELDDLLWYQKETDEGNAPVIEVKLKVKGRILNTAMIVSKRLNKSSRPIEIGRKDLVGFLVGETE